MIGSKRRTEFAGRILRYDGRRAWQDGLKPYAEAAVDFLPVIMRT